MAAIAFTIPLVPMSLQSSGKRMVIRNGKPMFFKNKKAETYQKAIKLYALSHLPQRPFSEALKVSYSFVLPRPSRLLRKGDPEGLVVCSVRPDLDNLVKGTQDALSDFWIDDAQIAILEVKKFYHEKGGSPRIEVKIEIA
jgi:Holliday junction resolvase RusA-like endonuclease